MDPSEKLRSRDSRHCSGDSSSSDDAVLVLSYEGDMIVMPAEGAAAYNAETVIKTEPESADCETQEQRKERQGDIPEGLTDHIKCEVKEEADDDEGEDPHCDTSVGGRFSRGPTITEADLPPDIYDYRVGNLYRCKFCNQKVRSRQQLLLHIERHIKNNSLSKCRHCDFITSMTQKLREHEWKHTNKKPYKCHLCPYKSRVLVDLQRHQDKHNLDKPYACQKCEFRTKWRKGLTKHMDVHKEVRAKPHACPHCNQAFRYSSALRTHLFRRHTDIKPLHCDQCSYRCKSNFELRSHKAKHGDVRPYACTHPGCGMAFKTKSDCTKHMWIHKNETRYSCEICGKGFKFKMGLKHHAVVHSDERTFECHDCMKRFKTLNALQSHIRTHLEIKPHRCDVCFKTFATRSNLLMHRQVHEGDRPFKCPMCVYGGRELDHLLVHIGGEHLGEFTYVCSVCRKPFSRSMQLQIHMKTCHRPEMGDAEMELVYDPQYLDLNFQPEDHDLSALQQLATAQSLSSEKGVQKKSPTKKKSPKKGAATTKTSTTASSMTGGKDGGTNVADETNLSVSAALLAPPPVVQICLFGGLKFCMARKGSGFTFNHQKKGKKCKSWFMNPEFMSADDAERHRVYLQKKGQGLGAVWSRKPKRRSRDWSGQAEKKSTPFTSAVKCDVPVEAQAKRGKSSVKGKRSCKRIKSWQHVESDSDSEDEAAGSFPPDSTIGRRDRMERAAASAAAAAVAAVFDVERETFSSPEIYMHGNDLQKTGRKGSHAVSTPSNSAEVTPLSAFNSPESFVSADIDTSAEISAAGGLSPADVRSLRSYSAVTEDHDTAPPRAKKLRACTESKSSDVRKKQKSGVKTGTQKGAESEKTKLKSFHHCETTVPPFEIQTTGTRQCQGLLHPEGNIKREPEDADNMWSHPPAENTSESVDDPPEAFAIRDKIREASAFCTKQSCALLAKLRGCVLSNRNMLEKERCLRVMLYDVCAGYGLLDYLKSNALNVGTLCSGPRSKRTQAGTTRKRTRVRGLKASAGKTGVGKVMGSAKKLSRTLAQSKAQEQGVGALLIAAASVSSPTKARHVTKEAEGSAGDRKEKVTRKGTRSQKIVVSPESAGSASSEGGVWNDRGTTGGGDEGVHATLPGGMAIKTEPVEVSSPENVSFTETVNVSTEAGSVGTSRPDEVLHPNIIQDWSDVSGGTAPPTKHKNKGGRPRKHPPVQNVPLVGSPSYQKTGTPDRSARLKPAKVQGMSDSTTKYVSDHAEAAGASDSDYQSLDTSGHSIGSSSVEYSPQNRRKSDRPRKIRPPITHPHSQIVLDRLKQGLHATSPKRKIPARGRLGILQTPVRKTSTESYPDSNCSLASDQTVQTSVEEHLVTRTPAVSASTEESTNVENTSKAEATTATETSERTNAAEGTCATETSTDFGIISSVVDGPSHKVCESPPVLMEEEAALSADPKELETTEMPSDTHEAIGDSGNVYPSIECENRTQGLPAKLRMKLSRPLAPQLGDGTYHEPDDSGDCTNLKLAPSVLHRHESSKALQNSDSASVPTCIEHTAESTTESGDTETTSVSCTMPTELRNTDTEKKGESPGQKTNQAMNDLGTPCTALETDSVHLDTSSAHIATDSTETDLSVLRAPKVSRKTKADPAEKRGHDSCLSPEVPLVTDTSSPHEELVLHSMPRVTHSVNTELAEKERSVSEPARSPTAGASHTVESGSVGSSAPPAPALKKKMGRPPKRKPRSTVTAAATKTATVTASAAEAGYSSSSAGVASRSKEMKSVQANRMGRPLKSNPAADVNRPSIEKNPEQPKKPGRLPQKKTASNNASGGLLQPRTIDSTESSSLASHNTQAPSTRTCLKRTADKPSGPVKPNTVEGDVSERSAESVQQTALLKKGSKKVRKTQAQKQLSHASAASKKVKKMLNKRKQNSAFKIVKPPKHTPKVKGGKKSKGQPIKQKKKIMYVELDLGLSPDHTPVKKRMGRPPGPKIIMDRSQTNLCFSPFTPPALPQEQTEDGAPADDRDTPPPVLLPELDEGIPFIDEIHPAEVSTRQRHRRRSGRLQRNGDRTDSDARLSPPVLQPETLVAQPSTSTNADGDGSDVDVEFVSADYSGVDLSEQRLPLLIDADSEAPDNVLPAGDVTREVDSEAPDNVLQAVDVITASDVIPAGDVTREVDSEAPDNVLQAVDVITASDVIPAGDVTREVDSEAPDNVLQAVDVITASDVIPAGDVTSEVDAEAPDNVLQAVDVITASDVMAADDVTSDDTVEGETERNNTVEESSAAERNVTDEMQESLNAVMKTDAIAVDGISDATVERDVEVMLDNTQAEAERDVDVIFDNTQAEAERDVDVIFDNPQAEAEKDVAVILDNPQAEAERDVAVILDNTQAEAERDVDVILDNTQAEAERDVDVMLDNTQAEAERDVDVMRGTAYTNRERDIDVTTPTDVEERNDVMRVTADIMREKDIYVMNETADVERKKDDVTRVTAETERDVDVMREAVDVDDGDSVIRETAHIERQADIDVLRESVDVGRCDVTVVMRNSENAEREIETASDCMTTLTGSEKTVIDTQVLAGPSTSVIERGIDVMNCATNATTVLLGVNVGSCVKVEKQELVKDDSSLPGSLPGSLPDSLPGSLPGSLRYNGSESTSAEGIMQSPAVPVEDSPEQDVQDSVSQEQTCPEQSLPIFQDNLNNTFTAEQEDVQDTRSTTSDGAKDVEVASGHRVQETLLNMPGVARDTEMPNSHVRVQENLLASPDREQEDVSHSPHALEEDHQEVDAIPVDSGLSSISSAEMSEGEVQQCERDLSPQAPHPQEGYSEGSLDKEQRHSNIVCESDFVLQDSETAGCDITQTGTARNPDGQSSAVGEMTGTDKIQVIQSLPDNGIPTVSSDISEADRAAIQISLEMENGPEHKPGIETDEMNGNALQMVQKMYTDTPAEDSVTKKTSLFRDDSDALSVYGRSKQTSSPGIENREGAYTETKEPKASFTVSVVGDLEGEGKEVAVKEVSNEMPAGDQSHNMLLLEVVENFSRHDRQEDLQTEVNLGQGYPPTHSVAREERGHGKCSNGDFPCIVGDMLGEQNPVVTSQTDSPPVSLPHRTHHHSHSLAGKAQDDAAGHESCMNVRSKDVTTSGVRQERPEVGQLPQMFSRQNDLLVEQDRFRSHGSNMFIPHNVHKNSSMMEKANMPSAEIPSDTNFTWVRQEYQTASEVNIYGQKPDDTPQDRPIMINIQAPSVNVYSNILHAPGDLPVHSHASVFDPNSVLNFSRSCAITTDSEAMRSAVHFESDSVVYSGSDNDFSDMNMGFLKGPYIQSTGISQGFPSTFPCTMAGVLPSAPQSSFTSPVTPTAFSEPAGQLGPVSSMCSDSANIVWQACQQVLLDTSQSPPKPSDVLLAGQNVTHPPPYMESSHMTSSEACYQLPQTALGSDLTKTARRNSSGLAASQISARPYCGGVNTPAAENRELNRSDSFSAAIRPLFRVDSREDSMALGCSTESLGPFEDQYGDFSVPLCLEADDDCVEAGNETLPDLNSGSSHLH